MIVNRCLDTPVRETTCKGREPTTLGVLVVRPCKGLDGPRGGEGVEKRLTSVPGRLQHYQDAITACMRALTFYSSIYNESILNINVRFDAIPMTLKLTTLLQKTASKIS